VIPLQREPDDGWQLADPVPVSPELREAIRGVIRAVCPLDVPEIAATPGLLARTEDGVRRSMAYMHPIPAFGLRLSFLLADWAPLLTLSSTRFLHDLEPAEAEVFLRRLEHGRLMTVARLVAGLRAAVALSFYDLPEVHKLLDYDPQPFMRRRVELRERLLTGGEATAADMMPPTAEQLLARAPSEPS